MIIFKTIKILHLKYNLQKYNKIQFLQIEHKILFKVKVKVKYKNQRKK